MRFTQIDRITEIVPNSEITAVKCLTLAEEYLDDHFPLFPVMPGVLMLEAMYQASAWLIRASEEFAHSIVALKECRNVKYADFVSPGKTLVIQSQILKQDKATTTLKAQGSLDGHVAVSARLILERYNLADRIPMRAATDDYTRREFRREFALLYRQTQQV